MFMTIGWLLASLLISGLLVRGAIGYAHRRGLLDQPGQRRSHRLPTPRGGGIGIVVAALLCLPGILYSLPAAWSGQFIITLLSALLLVALTGWWDDHRALPVWPRLAAQLVAITAFSLSLLSAVDSLWWLPLLLVCGVWSINLHNFMDGIDGLLAQQAIFTGLGLSLLAWSVSQVALALAAASLAAAAAGFGFYNRPPARIFMGDVGSGSVGLLIFAFSAMSWQRNPALLCPVLILSSAFVVDASLTLLGRILRGRRWHAAHREHLYQWLARRTGSHGRADRVYLAWNLLVAAPLAWLAWSHPRLALATIMGTYLAAAIAWLVLKRRCLRRHPHKACHVPA
ncbi:MAG TPA: glycosyltransferase family 4 protein [Rhodanobacter sp.]|nr:glycosyltransferase family 4 protein [Rhodanobacter sp.]